MIVSLVVAVIVAIVIVYSFYLFYGWYANVRLSKEGLGNKLPVPSTFNFYVIITFLLVVVIIESISLYHFNQDQNKSPIFETTNVFVDDDIAEYSSTQFYIQGLKEESLIDFSIEKNYAKEFICYSAVSKEKSVPNFFPNLIFYIEYVGEDYEFIILEKKLKYTQGEISYGNGSLGGLFNKDLLLAHWKLSRVLEVELNLYIFNNEVDFQDSKKYWNEESPEYGKLLPNSITNFAISFIGN